MEDHLGKPRWGRTHERWHESPTVDTEFMRLVFQVSWLRPTLCWRCLPVPHMTACVTPRQPVTCFIRSTLKPPSSAAGSRRRKDICSSWWEQGGWAAATFSSFKCQGSCTWSLALARDRFVWGFPAQRFLTICKRDTRLGRTTGESFYTDCLGVK